MAALNGTSSAAGNSTSDAQALAALLHRLSQAIGGSTDDAAPAAGSLLHVTA